MKSKVLLVFLLNYHLFVSNVSEFAESYRKRRDILTDMTRKIK